MELSVPTPWWLAAGLMVALELASGTFYLLMIALGLAAAAVAAHLGLSPSGQTLCFAAVGGGATALWHWHRFRQPHTAPASQNRDVNLDIGERVQVPGWSADGLARIAYRGSTWNARLAPGAAAQAGLHQVVAVEGNHLVLAPLPPVSA